MTASTRLRLAGLTTASTLIALGLALPAVSNAQSKAAPKNTPVSCRYEANGTTGGASRRGTQYVKQADNCANFWLISVTYAGHYTGYWLNSHGMWEAGATFYCGGGVCNARLLSNVPPGIRLTVNSSDGGGDPIRVGF